MGRFCIDLIYIYLFVSLLELLTLQQENNQIEQDIQQRDQQRRETEELLEQQSEFRPYPYPYIPLPLPLPSSYANIGVLIFFPSHLDQQEIAELSTEINQLQSKLQEKTIELQAGSKVLYLYLLSFLIYIYSLPFFRNCGITKRILKLLAN